MLGQGSDPLTLLLDVINDEGDIVVLVDLGYLGRDSPACSEIPTPPTTSMAPVIMRSRLSPRIGQP